MASVDVTVLGAGIFGLSIAWECARRGARVRVIDPNGPGAGSSGGVVGALAPHVPEQWNAKKTFQFDSLVAAAAFFRGIEDAAGLPTGYARTGRLQPLARDGRALADARAAGARTLWPGHVWRVDPASRFPDWQLSGEVIFDDLAARLHPRMAVTALVAALRATGAEVVRDAPLVGCIIHATGHAGLIALSQGRARAFGGGVKGQSALFAADLRDLPQLYIDALHIIPHADGTTALGSTSENAWTDPAACDAQLETLIARARELVPVLRDAPVIDRWAGVRPRARSRAPVLGAHPFRAGEFIANGGFKIGFGMAPGVARVMADLVLDGRDAIPAAFRPETCL
jgi:glycine oxidase